MYLFKQHTHCLNILRYFTERKKAHLSQIAHIFQRFVVVQSFSLVWLFVTLSTEAHKASWPSLSPGVCADSCPLRWWCHPTSSSSVAPFFSCPQSYPASRSFPMIWLFASGNQSIGDSASASVLPMNIQGWFSLGFIGLISLLTKRLSTVFCSSKAQFKSINSLAFSLLYCPTLTSGHDTGRTITLTIWTFVGKVMSLPFNMLCRFVIAFLP